MTRPSFTAPLSMLLLATAPAAVAQSRVSGTVRDSLSHRALPGAMVQLVGEHEFSRTATSDSLGHFAIDDVPAGRYMLGFFHPLLDSLGVEAPLRAVVVDGRAPTRADAATPSAPQLRAAVCGAGQDTSAALVVGVVRAAADGTPVAGATVSGDWLDLSFTSRGVVRRTPHLSATTGDNGWFALCNVPRGGTILLGARRGADSTLHVDQVVPAEGFLRRELYLGDGREGSVHGVVSTMAGNRPLQGARVHIAGAPDAVSNDRGEFTIGAAPLGTRVLEVRAVGYYPERRPVDVTAAMPSVLVALPTLRAVLDTVKVVGSPDHGRNALEFEQRRRSGNGQFVTPADIARLALTETSELFRRVPGLRYDGHDPMDSVLMRGGFGGWCAPSYYINGTYMQNLKPVDIDAFVPLNRVLGVEVYSGAGVPPQFQPPLSGCGSIVIWTR